VRRKQPSLVLRFSPCPSELGTHGAVDLPRSAVWTADAAKHSVASACDTEIKNLLAWNKKVVISESDFGPVN
jgi:hypothetical protein